MTPRHVFATVVVLAAAVAVLGLAGCGGDDPASLPDSTGATTESSPDTTSAGDDAMPHAGDESTTHGDDDVAAPSTGSGVAPAVETITIVVVGAQPQGGIKRPVVKQGDKVKLVVRTDGGEYIHLHGYDIEQDVVGGKPVTIAFTATIPGRFELEQHNPSAVLADIEVRP